MRVGVTRALLKSFPDKDIGFFRSEEQGVSVVMVRFFGGGDWELGAGSWELLIRQEGVVKS